MKLRVLTYNMHRAIGLDRRFRLERVSTILRHYHADIVFLQESDDNVPRSRRLNLAAELASILEYPHHVAGYNVTLRQGRYGNATLSRHPIVKSENIDLTLGRKKRRGCQHAIVDIVSSHGHKYQLNTFNLHLGLSPQERAEQIGMLAQSRPFKERDRSLPCMVAGDFNDWRNLLSPVFTGVMDFQCATNHKQGNQYPFMTFPSLSPAGGLDKIFFDGSLKLIHAFTCRLSVSKVASDHLPIIADFELIP